MEFRLDHVHLCSVIVRVIVVVVVKDLCVREPFCVPFLHGARANNLDLVFVPFLPELVELLCPQIFQTGGPRRTCRKVDGKKLANFFVLLGP